MQIPDRWKADDGSYRADAMSQPWDCLIVGGGPAGLTAAIYLGRFRRRVLVVDEDWSRAEWITLGRNIAGFPDGIAGPALLERLRKQSALYGATLQKGYVDGLRQAGGGKFVATCAGQDIEATTVILATGVVENKPPISHLADAVKHGLIRTCPICDGYENIDKAIAVLGNSEHAAGEALFLRTYTPNLTLLLVGLPIVLADTTQAALAAANIAVRHAAAGSVALQDHGATAFFTDDGQSHSFDVIYTAFGTTSQTGLARLLGAKMDASGRLYVSEHLETSVCGLYAAGDLVRGLNQINVAHGEAAIAATAVHNSLRVVAAEAAMIALSSTRRE